MTLRIRLQLELNATEVDSLIGQAVKRGFLRKNPRNAWYHDDIKEAVKYAIKKMITHSIDTSPKETHL